MRRRIIVDEHNLARMTELEKALFSEMLENADYEMEFATKYLKWDPNRVLEAYWPDEEIRFWRPVWQLEAKLSDRDILSLGNLMRNLLLSHDASTVRLFEWEISAGNFYTEDEVEEYADRHPDYSGGPFRLVDLKGASITDDNLYDNFIGYVCDREDESVELENRSSE